MPFTRSCPPDPGLNLKAICDTSGTFTVEVVSCSRCVRIKATKRFLALSRAAQGGLGVHQSIRERKKKAGERNRVERARERESEREREKEKERESERQRVRQRERERKNQRENERKTHQSSAISDNELPKFAF